MTFDPARVIYPSEIPPDPEHEAKLAEQIRVGEVAGLLREREQVLARREAVASRAPEKELIVVDAAGNDTGLRVKNITAAGAVERQALTTVRPHLRGFQLSGLVASGRIGHVSTTR
jgi:hypothetical protein